MKTAIWDIEPHTRAKHDILVNYLGAWYPVLGTTNKRVIFFDGFAGPGIYTGGEPGSPPLALRTLLDHSFAPGMASCEFVFIFVEQDSDRFASLQAVVESERVSRGDWPANVKVILQNDNFIAVADSILTKLNGQRLAPTFAFVDPFGYRDVPIDTIKRFLDFATCELFIYFDYNSVNRFGTAGVVDAHFESLFGTKEFMNAPPAGDPMRRQFFHDLYESQLKAVCGFVYVRSFEMVNKQNRTGNYLFFCTRSLTGLRKMKEAMWKIAPLGDYRYSDLLAGQQILFELEVDVSPLAEELRREFSGRTVPIEAVEEFTLVSTPFAASHLKKRTLAPMQREGKISSPNQKRKNTYPPGTLISF